MQAAVVTEVGRVVVERIDDPTPATGEVVVRVTACGLCGTDLHIVDGEFAPRLPLVPGHEFAGEVVALGSGVASSEDLPSSARLAVGDRVAVDPSLYCFRCQYCRSGRNNLCEQWGAIGVSAAGGAAEYAAVPAANCVRLPEHVDPADAALIEPLSCAVRGYDVLRAALASKVLIYGAGTMGLMMLQLGKLSGAARIDVVDVNEAKLKVASRLGCSAVAPNADALDRPQGWDVVIDATGNTAAIQDGINRVAAGGTFLQFGVASTSAQVHINPYRVYNKEITITGSMAVLHSYERAADLFAGGVLDPTVFITDRLPLADYEKALERFRAGHGLKTQVRP